VVRCCVWSRNLVNEEALAHWGGGCCAQNKEKCTGSLFSFVIHKKWTLSKTYCSIRKRQMNICYAPYCSATLNYFKIWNLYSFPPPSGTSVHHGDSTVSHFLTCSILFWITLYKAAQQWRKSWIKLCLLAFKSIRAASRQHNPTPRENFAVPIISIVPVPVETLTLRLPD